MSIEESEDLVHVVTQPDHSDHLEKSIRTFNQPLADFLQQIGLPTEDVLSPVAEREQVIKSLEEIISIVPDSERTKAFYLSKFTVAVAVGLFDSALNYLWDETIKALRRLVERFDLAYFFSVVGEINSRHKGLSKPEDLELIRDHDLLESCRRIGLISDINYTRLEYVNYFRNNASAAHPNENEIDGIELLNFLNSCLKYAIVAKPDTSAISIKQLLDNVRTQVIPESDCSVIGNDIAKLSQERIDDLLSVLFGMYTDATMSSDAKINISNLANDVWYAASEDRKYETGAKFGQFRKNAEVVRKNAAKQFLQIVDGQQYKDEESLAFELIEDLKILKSVHFDWNNFYNEYPHARNLDKKTAPTGNVPRAARPLWVKVNTLGYIGNGHGRQEGVDEKAVIYYKKHIEAFTEVEIREFIYLMTDIEVTCELMRTKPEQRIRKMIECLKKRASNIFLKKALDLMTESPNGTLYKIQNTSKFKGALQRFPKLE